MDHLNFDSPPSLGHTLEIGARRYECVGVEPYTRRTDGAASWLLTWHGECEHCGLPFSQRSGLKGRGLSAFCERHRALGNYERQLANMRRGRATQKENRRKAKALAKLLK